MPNMDVQGPNFIAFEKAEFLESGELSVGEVMVDLDWIVPVGAAGLDKFIDDNGMVTIKRRLTLAHAQQLLDLLQAQVAAAIPQLALDVQTPVARNTDPAAAHEGAAAVTGSGSRLTSAERVLARLRLGGWITNTDLRRISHRFGGRICDLRKSGYQIETRQLDGTLFEYRLVPTGTVTVDYSKTGGAG